jgi:hypothetical protein
MRLAMLALRQRRGRASSLRALVVVMLLASLDAAPLLRRRVLDDLADGLAAP